MRLRTGSASNREPELLTVSLSSSSPKRRTYLAKGEARFIRIKTRLVDLWQDLPLLELLNTPNAPTVDHCRTEW